MFALRLSKLPYPDRRYVNKHGGCIQGMNPLNEGIRRITFLRTCLPDHVFHEEGVLRHHLKATKQRVPSSSKYGL
jgi:hypothetical protein